MTDPGDTQPGKPVRRTPEPAPAAPSPPTPSPAVPPPPITPPAPPPVQVSGTVGGDVAGRDVNKELNAGRDIVGRDVVTSTTTTNVGFSVAAVQRLVLSVGALVFITAACFFSGGVVVGGAALVALDRPVNSQNEAAASRFAQALHDLQALPAGQPFRFTFTEEEISSYFRLVVAPSLPGEITDGKVRLLDNGDLVVGGRAGFLGNAAFASTFTWQDTPGEPLRLKGAALRLLPGGSAFGWVAVPVFVLRPVTSQINSLFGGVQFTNVDAGQLGTEPAWQVEGVGR